MNDIFRDLCRFISNGGDGVISVKTQRKLSVFGGFLVSFHSVVTIFRG